MRWFFLVSPIVLMGCTLSFTNVDTHGVATDLVDETQGTEASPNVEFPFLPK